MTAKWQAGKLYPKGSMVIPATEAAPAFSTVITNAGFDDGTAAGWTLGTGVTVVNTGAYQGTYNIQFTGTAGAVTAIHDRVPVSAGVSITASCMYAQGAASAGHNGGKVILRWYKADLSVISDSAGNDVNSASGGRWYQSTVTAVAPTGAAFVAIGITVNRDASQPSWADTFQWNYTNAQVQPPAGLVYRAVQPNTGMSAPTEPVWPTTVGVQVTDNQVIWEGVLASRVVWEANPIMKSGPTEPTWPTNIGELVADNTVSWECFPRRVDDDKCPNGTVVAIVASKIFVADKDIVRFCATANPLDWSTPNDAGYLPTGLQQANGNDMKVLSPYRSNLGAWNASSFQMWQVDPNPAAMALLDQMEGIGSEQQHAAQPVGNDLLYLSQLGVRSVGIANAAQNLQANDIGAPIDLLVRVAMKDAPRAVATYYPSAGQYWLAFQDPPPPGSRNVVLWSGGSSSTGITIDPTQAFNAELVGATTVLVTGYFVPNLTVADPAYTYPPAIDPLPVDLSGYAYVPITPIPLTTGHAGPGLAMWWADAPNALPINQRRYANVTVDGVLVLASIFNSPGF